MRIVKIPWSKWLDEGEKELTFPEDWRLRLADEIMFVPDLGDEDISRAFVSPIGVPSIAEMARNRSNAVIAVDDISRPTPTHRLLPRVLKELELGGIDQSKVRIVVASGSHRQSTRRELINKLGRNILDTMDIFSHVPYENLVDLGKSKLGTPVLTNRVFFEGDLKIGIGSIMPHATAGFGGGRKLVSVGLSATSTLNAFHQRDDGWIRTGFVEGNIQHDDLEDIMSMVGLDLVVDVILTGRGGIAALLVGEPTLCFKIGVEKAWKVYATSMPSDADVVVLNAYPKDYDLLQASVTALCVTLFPNMHIVRPGGTVVFTAACPDGVGLHFLASHEMSAPTLFKEESFEGRHLIIYSPNVSDIAVKRHFPGSVSNYRRWEDVLIELQTRHGNKARVTIYPCASLHLNPDNKGRGAIPF